jgi:hypothetical protein
VTQLSLANSLSAAMKRLDIKKATENQTVRPKRTSHAARSFVEVLSDELLFEFLQPDKVRIKPVGSYVNQFS